MRKLLALLPLLSAPAFAQDVGDCIFETITAHAEATVTWDPGPAPIFDSTCFAAAEVWLLFVDAGVNSSVNGFADAEFRMHDQTSVMLDSEAIIEPRGTSTQNGHVYNWMYEYTVPGTPVDLELELRVSTTANGTSAQRGWAKGYGINTSDLDASDYQAQMPS